MSGSVERIASALLYEGYMLYPYRPSAVKNRQRFNFGVLWPERCVSPDQDGTDRAYLQTECLLEGDGRTGITVTIRFLQLVERVTIRDTAESWQEAVERSVTLDSTIADLVAAPRSNNFAATAGVQAGSADEAGSTPGVVVRRQQTLAGTMEVSAVPCGAGLFRLRVRVTNQSEPPYDQAKSRDAGLLRSLVSTHAILTARDGRFVSLIDPPPALADAAAQCHNDGVWPVLVGDEGQRDTMLASPIILYDYPAIAPESAGDLFDGTEIDEILSLRIMTLTDAEKQEVRRSDERARRLLERTESLSAEDWMRLHGVLRQPEALQEERS